MTAQAGDLLAGARVLDGLWSVETVAMYLGTETLFPGAVLVSTIRWHAGSFADAERVAARLGLAPKAQTVIESAYGLPESLRRTWLGWAATEPGQVPVSVELLAFEDLADHATPTGPGARDGWESVPLFGEGSDTDDNSADEPVTAAA